MKGDKNTLACMWGYRFELLGLILIIIASILTIVHVNSVGIASMFLVGLVLFAHKCISASVCRICHPEECEKADKEAKATTKKTTKT